MKHELLIISYKSTLSHKLTKERFTSNHQQHTGEKNTSIALTYKKFATMITFPMRSNIK